jgi:hypothetical protein
VICRNQTAQKIFVGSDSFYLIAHIEGEADNASASPLTMIEQFRKII